MYTTESVKKRIKTMGVDAFIKWFSEVELSDEIIAELEKIHIISNGYLCLSSIYLLAQVQ